MRILLTLPALIKHGANAVAIQRAQRWTELGHHVDVLLVSDRDKFEQNKSWIPDTLRTQFSEGIYPSFRPKTAVRMIKPTLLARKADIVVSSQAIGPGMIVGGLAATIARKPFSVVVQNNIQDAFAL